MRRTNQSTRETQPVLVLNHSPESVCRLETATARVCPKAMSKSAMLPLCFICGCSASAHHRALPTVETAQLVHGYSFIPGGKPLSSTTCVVQPEHLRLVPLLRFLSRALSAKEIIFKAMLGSRTQHDQQKQSSRHPTHLLHGGGTATGRGTGLSRVTGVCCVPPEASEGRKVAAE